MAILMKTAVPAAHWYARDGHPAHEQMKKDGSGTRSTTIRDAAKIGLLPSVTSILSILGKPGLEVWKMRKVAEAALYNPKQAEESDSYWVERVLAASKEEVGAAADLGSEIHNALDAALEGAEPDDAMRPYVAPVLKWLADTQIEITHREVVLTSLDEGYAGRVDALFQFGQAGIGIIDWKTRKTEPGKECTPYDGQGMQLAAYAAAGYGPEYLHQVVAANVYISTTEPGRVEVYKHANLVELYAAFLSCCHLWRHLKGYDPRQAAA